MLHSGNSRPPVQKVYYGPDGAFVSEASRSAASDFTIRRISTREDAPFATADALLREHASFARKRALKDGGPEIDVSAHANAFWTHLDDYLPPNGSYYLATDSHGALIGTGSMRRVSADIAEMKHLFVRPEARGLGLGRRLVEMRMQDARAMGIRTLFADTLPLNVEMLSLYDSLGFHIVPPFVESGAAQVAAELGDYMIFLRYDFPG